MLKKILLSLLALLAILVLVGLALSQHYAVSRSLVIQAPVEKVFPLIGDLANWPAWEPFTADSKRRGDEMALKLGDKTTGVGASQSWSSKTESGRLTFTACDPKLGIDYDLVFTNGKDESLAKSSMHLTPEAGSTTQVVWSIQGEMNMPVIGGYFARFADEKMGGMFEAGLANLKRKAESP